MKRRLKRTKEAVNSTHFKRGKKSRIDKRLRVAVAAKRCLKQPSKLVTTSLMLQQSMKVKLKVFEGLERAM